MESCHSAIIFGSLLLACSNTPASVSAYHVTYTPTPPFRGDNREAPEPVHPPDGEGVPTTLSVISSSGTISNVAATAMSYSVEPPSAHHSWFKIEKPARASDSWKSMCPSLANVKFFCPALGETVNGTPVEPACLITEAILKARRPKHSSSLTATCCSTET